MSGYESDTCGRSYTIRIRYVWTQIFLYPHKKICGYVWTGPNFFMCITPCEFFFIPGDAVGEGSESSIFGFRAVKGLTRKIFYCL